MSEAGDHKRHISAHRLPVSLPLPRVSPNRPGAPQAAFLTQLLSTAPAPGLRGPDSAAPEVPGHSTYRRVEASDIKRMPSGYRKTVSA